MGEGNVGWGILAPGAIASLLATDLDLVPGTEVVAVGSRDRQRAERFTATYGGTAYGSYDEVLADPRVDVVYVASPHALHLEQATRALSAGKHVLCEKPLTLDLATSEQLVALARQHDRFLMEAMWTACHPVVRDLAARLRAGDFGTPHQVSAAFCFAAGVPREHRLRNPLLGGGALLDLGIYPLTFAHLMLGEAEELRATGTLDERVDQPGAGGLGAEPPAGVHGGGAPVGVDLDVAIAGRYPGGTVANLAVSIASDGPCTATITTDQGWIEVAGEFHHPASYAFHRPGRDPVVHTSAEPVIGIGYGNEVAEVVRCLREGLRESPLVPLDRTLLIMGQLDDLRAQVAAGA